MHRSLSAVLAADIVGYSRLMNEDATGTLATLKRLRAEVMGPLVAARRGKLVKSMGDGWIVTFSSVTDAVECAMQVQDRLKVDGALQLRTGVHIGDIAVEDEDVFGEGVNIAARLQEIAEPGALAISDPVYALLDGTLRPSFDDAGQRDLKNIHRPLRIWTRGGEVAGRAAELKAAGFPKLTIRPVETSDQRPEIRELAAALTGDLASHLDGVFRVMSARVSRAPDAGSYELVTTLRVFGPRLRLESQLMSPDGETVESTKVDGDMEDIFNWQDTASVDFGQKVMQAIIRTEATKAGAIPESARSAEQWVLTAIARHVMDLSGYKFTLSCFERATALQPDNGFIHAQALGHLTGAISLGYGPNLGPVIDKLEDWAEKVDRLEPAHSPARILLAFGRLVQSGEAAVVRSDIRALTRQLPFDSECLIWAGWLHLYLGEPKVGLEYLDRLRLGVVPEVYQAAVHAGIGFAKVQLGQYEQALPDLESALAFSPEYTGALGSLISACGQLGRLDEARDYRDRYDKIIPGMTIAGKWQSTGYVDTPSMRRYFDGLKKAGLPE